MLSERRIAAVIEAAQRAVAEKYPEYDFVCFAASDFGNVMRKTVPVRIRKRDGLVTGKIVGGEISTKVIDDA